MSRPRITPEMAAEAAKKDFQLEVKLQRVRLDMSQRELGDQIGVVPSVMSELLANPDKISVARLRGIIKALNMDPLPILRMLGISEKDLRTRFASDDRVAPGSVVPLRRYQ